MESRSVLSRKRKLGLNKSQRKWRQTSVYCNCKLCNGTVILKREDARKHVQKFGAVSGLTQTKYADEDASSSSSDDCDYSISDHEDHEAGEDVITAGGDGNLTESAAVEEAAESASVRISDHDHEQDSAATGGLSDGDSSHKYDDNINISPNSTEVSAEETSLSEDEGKTSSIFCDGSGDIGQEDILAGGSQHEDALYQSANAKLKLYDGAEGTVLETLAYFFQWFTEHPSISKSALSELLRYNHETLLPQGNNLPKSYEEAYKFIQPFLLQTVEYHVCPNDCVVFRKSTHFDYSKLLTCPVCGENRFARNRQPSRRFIYYPLIPRLQRYYTSSAISKILQNHFQQLDVKDDQCNDIWQANVWKNIFSENGIFNGDPRCIGMQFSTDGVNPFSINKVQYSMWPIMLSLVNLPKTLRHHHFGISLLGIIPGNGNSEPNSLDPYMEIVVDELQQLSTGITTYDALSDSTFKLKAEVVNYVLDYPAMNKVFSTTGTNSIEGCMWCETQGCRNGCLDKVVYPGSRKFLPQHHPLRKDKEHFPSKSVELGKPPQMRQYSDMLWDHLAYERAPNKSQATIVAKATGCKSLNSFMLLPHHNRTTQAFPDPMHTVPNAVQAIFRLITGRDDSIKVRRAEKELGRFGEACDFQLQETHLLKKAGTSRKKGKGGRKGKKAKMDSNIKGKESNNTLPDAPFILTKEELAQADESVSCIRVPLGMDWKPKPFFSKHIYMKSHDWKEAITERVLVFALMGCLGDEQRSTFCQFLQILEKILNPQLLNLEVQNMQEEINVVLALIERDFPISVQTISMHLLRHVVTGVESFGPVHSWSMFMYERFNSWICRRVTNRRYPEATVMETYKIYDWIQYLKLSGRVTFPSQKNGEKEKAEKPKADKDLENVNLDDEGNLNQDLDGSSSEDEELFEERITTETTDEPDLQLLNQFLARCQLDGELTCPPERFYRKEATDKVTGKNATWMGAIKEWRKGRVSSIVSVNDTSASIGEIQYFLKFTFRGSEFQEHAMEVAVVKVYRSHPHDEGFGLLSVSMEEFDIIALPLTVLSLPLITALKKDNLHKLWVLNYRKVVS